MRALHVFAALMCLVAFSSCGGGTQPSSQDGGDTVRFKYARLLQVVRHDGYTEVCVSNPWHKDRLLHRYLLVPRGVKDAGRLPEGTLVRIPLQRVIPFSVVHAGLIMDLGCTDAIVAMADQQYVRNPLLRRLCRSGQVADVGSSMSPVIEQVMDATPDAVFVSPFENAGGYGRLEETGVPIIECAEYMEPTALGRAEWVRFFGLLMGREHTADSLFAVVDSSYSALKAKAASAKSRPSVLMDKKTGSVWYVPGGRSTLGAMLADAGASYPFAGNGDAGSLALPFETVLAKAGDADIWMFRYGGRQPVTYAGLLSEFHGYGEISAYRGRRCYGCNVDVVPFYEETPFRPDFLLADFIQVVHPELKGLGGLRYFRPVVE